MGSNLEWFLLVRTVQALGLVLDGIPEVPQPEENRRQDFEPDSGFPFLGGLFDPIIFVLQGFFLTLFDLMETGKLLVDKGSDPGNVVILNAFRDGRHLSGPTGIWLRLGLWFLALRVRLETVSARHDSDLRIGRLQ